MIYASEISQYLSKYTELCFNGIKKTAIIAISELDNTVCMKSI